MAVGVQADPLKDSVEWWSQQQETMPAAGISQGVRHRLRCIRRKACIRRISRSIACVSVPLSYVPNRPLIRGWDVPGPVGVVWLQRVPLRSTGPGQSQNDGFARCHILAEFLMDGSVEEAGPPSAGPDQEQFPQAVEVIDFADPAAFDRRANDSQSAADILRRSCGIHLSPGPRTLTARFEPVRRWLLGAHPYPGPGEPMGKLLIDPNCPRLKEAFKSAYHFKTLPGAQARYHDIPEKNWASHIMNALEYAIGRLDAGLDEPDAHEAPAPLGIPARGGRPAARVALLPPAVVTAVADAMLRITGRDRLTEPGVPDHERRARRRRRSRSNALARRLEPLPPPIFSVRVIPRDQNMLSA